MKKILLCLFIVFFMVVGCDKVENLTISSDNKVVISDEEILEIFKDASSDYNDVKLNPIALLGTQVVAGTNYMFLCESGEKNDAWKVAIVYKDLEGVSKITSVVDFDYNVYYGKDNEYTPEVLMGGWSNNDVRSIMLDESIQRAFDQATNSYDKGMLLPVALLASSENHSVILCKKTLENANADVMFSVITVKDSKLTNVYDLNLATFNK